MPFNPKPAGALQYGKGGRRGLDAYAQTMFDGCCTNGAVPDYDTLVNPLGFDNGLSHLSPKGGRDVGRFGSQEQQARNEEMVDYINRVGVGAIIYLLRLPSFAQITSFAASVYAMDAGLVLKVVGRNNFDLPSTGKKIVVPIEGCSQKDFTEASAALGALEALATPAAANQSEHFVYVGGSATTLHGNSNDIGLQVVTMPASGMITMNNLVELSVSYDVPLFLLK